MTVIVCSFIRFSWLLTFKSNQIFIMYDYIKGNVRGYPYRGPCNVSFLLTWGSRHTFYLPERQVPKMIKTTNKSTEGFKSRK